MAKKTGKLPIERVLTTSLRNLWTTCHRRFHYRVIEGLKPLVTPRPLAFGSMVHAGLAAYYGDTGACASDVGAKADEYIDALRDLTDQEAAQKAIEETEENRRKALDLLTRYFDYWGPHDQQWEVLGVEQRYETRLRTPNDTPSHWRFAGIFDLVVRNRLTGRINVVDFKTTATRDREAYASELELDPQSRGYVMLAQEHFHEPVDFVFDVLRKAAPCEPKALVCKGKCSKLAKEGKSDPDCPKCHGTNVVGFSVKTNVDTTPEKFKAAMEAHPHVAWTPEYETHMERLSANADSWFYRLDLGFSADDLHSFHAECYEVTREMSEANYWTRNLNACQAPGRKCVYRQLCLDEGNGAKQDEARAMFAVEKPGGAPELAEKEEQKKNEEAHADLMASDTPF